MFNGEATDNELTLIRQWVNENEANKETFYRERAFFDAIQFNDLSKAVCVRKRHVSLLKWTGSVVAAVITLFLLYNVSALFQKDFTEEVVFNTIKVPAGQRVEVTLADGTHLWLNACSELSYPVSFNGNKREVRLKGEAFFDVAKDKNKKFIVHTDRCEIEVLGTQFNVEAYTEDDFSTALLQGSVRVTDTSQQNESVVLEPNNAVRLDHGRLTVTPITDLSAYSWKDGVFTFKDIDFNVLMKRLEKNYGIRIIIENPELDDYACSGKIRISDGVDEVLEALQQDAHFSFEWQGTDEIRIQ